jgi:serine protease Do
LRFLRTLILLGLLLGSVPGQRARAADPAIDWSSVGQQVVPATVNITADRIVPGKNGLGHWESLSGSGFIVDPSGAIVTNRHVVAGAFRITVTLHDGAMLRARLVGAAAMVDIAILEIDVPHPLPSLHLANDDALRVGEPVLAVGNPLGLGTSLSAGIISALNRDLRKSPFDDYIQTDAAINHGNSGGPLVDKQGQVIGVDTVLLTNLPGEGSNGLGFAISSTVVGYVVRHLLDPASAPVGWIGVQVQDVTSDLARTFDLANASGFIVTGIDQGSPAAQAGLQPGDIVLPDRTAGVRDARALMRHIATAPIGSTVRLLVWRGGHESSIPVTVQAWPHLMEPRGETLAAPGANMPARPPDLGMLLAPITPAARQRYGLKDVQGVLVVAVDEQSEAYGQRIRAGDVVENVDGTPVTTPAEFLRLVDAARRREKPAALLVRWNQGPRWVVLHTGHGGARESAGTMTASGEPDRDNGLPAQGPGTAAPPQPRR